jgi:Ca2+:H+ antiporter
VITDIPEARPPARPRLIPGPPPARPPAGGPWWRRIPATTPLLLAAPLTLWLRHTGAAALGVFVCACLALIPLAAWMGWATARLAERSGVVVGGLLNAAFGNAAELIIAIAALRAGYLDLVRASITGSILGNLLLLLGLALLTGGLREPVLVFDRTATGMSAVMLSLAVAALVFPALVHLAHPASALGTHAMSIGVSIILIITYLLSLLFVFRSRTPLFGTASARPSGARSGLAMPFVALAVAAAVVALQSDALVAVIEPVTRQLGMSPMFLGLILIPLVGNAAEHATAIGAARRGQLELSLQISLGSSTQVALLVAPILVLIGAAIASPLDLVFPVFEMAALAIGVIVSSLITLDGESHWLEGVQLLGLYGMIAVAAWFI